MSCGENKTMDFKLTRGELSPITVALSRNTTDDITLSDGTFVPKATHFALSCEKEVDPTIYHEPLQYDPYRFLHLREKLGPPRGEAWATLGGASNNELPHYLFGFGQHLCPGRAFGTHLAKLVMYHVLKKYEFQPAGGDDASLTPMGFGLNEMANSKTKLMVRRRRSDS